MSKVEPLKKYSGLAEYARVSVYHNDRFTQVEIYETRRFGSVGGYLNAPKRFKGADVKYIDGKWCWVLDVPEEMTP